MPDHQPSTPTSTSLPAALPATTSPVATPTILTPPEEDGPKPLTSGQIGAILATITVLVILSLAGLHLLLSRRRKRHSHHPSLYDDDGSTGSSAWSSRATREGVRVRETVERVDVNWAGAGGRGGGGGGSGRRAPKRHEVSAYDRIVPVYGNVRHVRKPPASYFRG